MKLDSRKLDDCVGAMDALRRRADAVWHSLFERDDEWSEEAREAAARARGTSSHRETQPHPFVHAFAREHDTIGKQRAYLRTVPPEKLHTALKLIGQSGDRGAMSNSVRGLIEEELKSRGASKDARLDEFMRTVADWSPQANQVVKSTASVPHSGANELK
jgi:hypothetical protein